MGDVNSIFELCAAGGLAFWFVGSCMLLIGVRLARSEFRAKGYLRTPKGTRWFRFLLMKHYEAFDRPSTRTVFGIAHFCLIAIFVALAAIVVLLASVTILN